MKRRLCAFLLALVICLPAMFAVATPSKAVIVLGKGNAGNSVYWEVYDNGTLYIYGYGKMKDYTSMSYPVWNAYGIKKVVISKGVTSIGSYAFFNCRDMTAISIPSSVTTIGSGAFLECPKLAEVHVESIDAWCKLTNAMDSYGYYINPLKANSNNKQLYVDKELVTHLVIPNGVTSIAQNAFYLCATVTSVEIPDTVTSIGAWAFLRCEGLTAITVPESVTSIEMCAFAGCIGLKEITLPYVGLGNNPGFSFGAVFGDANFTGTVCTTQRYLDTSGTTQRYHSYYIPSGLSKVTITGGQIPAYAFENCSTIESVVLPDGITEIKSKTFSYCTNLRSVDLPEGLIAIGDGAFSVTNLDSITIPEGVEVIDERAFSECYSLETMIIPDTVISIGSYAFLDCVSLEDIYYGGTEAEWAIRCDASTSAFVHYSCVNPDGHWSNRSVTGDCTSAGYTVDTCPCGYEKNKQPTGEAPGHKEVIDAAVAATCSTDGKTEGKHCSVCGTVTKAQEVVKATGHSFTEGKCVTCGAEDPNYVKPTEPEVTEPEVTEPKPTEPEVTEPKPTEPEVKGVTRVFGADRYATAFKAADTLKAELGVQKFQNVIVASGTGFADALAGSYLAAQKNAPILLVRGANVNDVKNYIKNNLASGGNVYLLGGVNAVPQTMETGLDGFKVKRLGGADRYTTNLLILQEAGVGNKDIIVCTGLNFADSLSASATGLPILLVKGGLTDSQKVFLASSSGKKIIVGGTAAVGASVEIQLKAYGEVKRLAGNTRYDTSVLVAKEFFDAPTSAVLAYAQNFPDGLSGGPLAYVLNAPLILTDNNKPTAAVNYGTSLGIKSGYVMGGPGLISDKVVNDIFGQHKEDIEVSLSVDKDYIEMFTGETAVIKATATGSGTLTWSSSDTSVATVSDGKVTAKGEGTAVITATYGGKKAQCVIQVYASTETPAVPEIGPAVSVSKSGNNGSWDVGCVGNSLSFNAVAKTADGENRGVTATSSNTGVATVSTSANGSRTSVKVSFKGSGSVTITLTSDDGKASTSFTINVRGYSAQDTSTPEAYAAAINYVVGMNGCSVSSGGNYTVLTMSPDKLSWGSARAQGEGIAQRSWTNGTCRAGCSYQGVDEYGEYVFYLYTT